MDAEPWRPVRAFNRFYTRVIGVLRKGCCTRPYTLTEARVIFELAQSDAAEVVALRRALGLDAGYLSRLLGPVRAGGPGRAVPVRDATAGARSSRSPTRAATPCARPRQALGRARSARCSDRSARPAGAGCSARWPRSARSLGAPEPARLVVLRPPRARRPRLDRAAARRPLRQAHGWDATFEALVARIVADFAAGHDPAREALWIAEVDGEPVGCVMCVRGRRRHRAATGAAGRAVRPRPRARCRGWSTSACASPARAGYRRMMLLTTT